LQKENNFSIFTYVFFIPVTTTRKHAADRWF